MKANGDGSKLQIWFSRLDVYDDGWWLCSLLWLCFVYASNVPLCVLRVFSYWLFTLFNTKTTTNDIIQSADTLCSMMMINIIDIWHMYSVFTSCFDGMAHKMVFLIIIIYLLLFFRFRTNHNCNSMFCVFAIRPFEPFNLQIRAILSIFMTLSLSI